MTISQLFCPVVSKSLPLLIISVVLTACSTEENFTDSTTSAGTGVVQGVNPEPVSEPSLETAPVATLSVSPSNIDLGQSTTLSWSSTDADSCIASGGWSSARSTTGTVDVKPAMTSTYTLTCNGAGGSASDSVTVTVKQPSPLPPAPVANLSVSRSSIDQGQSATLSWTSTNATSCTASGGWSGTRSSSGSRSVSPSATAIYTLTCNGAGGSASDSVSVTVKAPPPPVPVVNLSVSPSSIDQGQSATLSWSSTNATGCTASGAWGGSRNISGIVTVSPVVTSTYTLTCNGAGGSVSDSVTVTVNQPPPSAQYINLSWVPPVEREDGTPITMAEIAGYRIYYGTVQGNYTNNVDIADSSTMQATLSNLTTGTYYIVMTTYDVDGRESVFSQVVTKSI